MSWWVVYGTLDLGVIEFKPYMEHKAYLKKKKVVRIIISYYMRRTYLRINECIRTKNGNK